MTELRTDNHWKKLRGQIEAILFVTGDAVQVDQMAVALRLPLPELNQALDRLRDEYEAEERGFMLKRFGHQVQLATRPLYAKDVIRLLQPVQRQSLSQAAMETLAVVAYRQPVTRLEVEEIRGVKCDYSLQVLTNKGLIGEVGRKETVGRPILYGTTEEFLAHFGIETLDDLPPLPERVEEEPEPDQTTEGGEAL